MCGIVAVVRRPTDRTPPSLPELAAELSRAPPGISRSPSPRRRSPGPLDDAAAPRRGGRRRAARRARDPGPHRRPGRGRRPSRPSSRRQQDLLARIEAAPRRRRRGRPGRARDRQRRAGPGQGRGVGRRPRPAPRRPRGRGARRRAPARPPRSRRSPRCRWRSRRSTGSRCAAATPPGSISSSVTTASTSTTREHRAPRCASASADPLFRSGAVRVTGRCAQLRLQGGRGDRRARRQRRACCAARSPSDALLHRALDNDTGARRRARSHPLGERRHHLGGERAPAQPGGAGAQATATRTSTAALNGDVDNYAELVAQHDLDDPARDHHRRQGHPRARRAGGSTRART